MLEAALAASAQAVADAIIANRYRVVALDMDQTLLKMHSHGCLRRQDLPKYIASVSNDAVALVLKLHASGAVRLAVATHSDEAEYGWTRDAITGVPTAHETHCIGEGLAREVEFLAPIALIPSKQPMPRFFTEPLCGLDPTLMQYTSRPMTVMQLLPNLRIVQHYQYGNAVHVVHTQCKVLYVSNYLNPSFGPFSQVCCSITGVFTLLVH